MIRAAFTKALRYEVRLTCCSPLCTTGVDWADSDILCYPDGTAFLQGASLAGALRDWRPDTKLFGKRYVPGSLIFSDLVFDRPELTCDPDRSRLSVRPHMKMDSAKGTPGGKGFLTTALQTGTSGSFTLVWCGDKPFEAAAADIEPYLAALHFGQIHLGGGKHNGFGRVRLDVKRRCYDLTKQADRQDWLDGIGGGTPIHLKKEQDRDVLFTVTARMPIVRTKGALAHTAGSHRHVQSMPVRENNRSLIPSSSIKGAMRVQMGRIAEAMGSSVPMKEMLGDWGVAGKLYFSDGIFISPETEQIFTRITIDRFTGGLIPGKRLCDQATGGTVQWQIRVPEGTPRYCALVLFALRDFGLGLYTLGDGYARGWGFAESLDVAMETPEGTAALRCEGGAVDLNDPSGVTAGWIASLKGGAT